MEEKVGGKDEYDKELKAPNKMEGSMLMTRPRKKRTTTSKPQQRRGKGNGFPRGCLPSLAH